MIGIGILIEILAIIGVLGTLIVSCMGIPIKSTMDEATTLKVYILTKIISKYACNCEALATFFTKDMATWSYNTLLS